jgi:2-keto-3-deoxy-L-rhamnonate aldolase RhmA
MKTDLKNKLIRKDLTIGSWITFRDPAVAEIMAHSGFDWLAVDLEHSVISIREAGELIRVIDLCGVSPLVRLSANDPVQIKRVMDAGSSGVIVPMINSAQEAKQAADALYYPPKGSRSVGLARAQGYGYSFEVYRQWLSDAAVLIVQIEHIRAVENLEAILAVDGVDGFFVGPYDLSASLGFPGQFDHPLFMEAMSRIRTIGGLSNKSRGVHVVEPDRAQLKERAGEGYNFIAYSVDMRMLDVACRSALAAF